MVRKLALALVGITASVSVASYLLTLPLLLRLPKPSRVSLDGITTIDDAVEACRRSHLHGWELVAYAQHLVARKFIYSRLNPWDTPARAFERGLGYCQQQALSLQRIYDRLGIQSRPVFAQSCLFPPKTIDGMPWPGGVSGHVLLRICVDGEERDVCSGSVANTPGVTTFRVLSKVRTLPSLAAPVDVPGIVARKHPARRGGRAQRGASSPKPDTAVRTDTSTCIDWETDPGRCRQSRAQSRLAPRLPRPLGKGASTKSWLRSPVELLTHRMPCAPNDSGRSRRGREAAMQGHRQ